MIIRAVTPFMREKSMNRCMDNEIEWNTTRARPKHNVAIFQRPNDVMEFASASRAATVPAHVASQCHMGVFRGLSPTPRLLASLISTAAPSFLPPPTMAQFGQQNSISDPDQPMLVPFGRGTATFSSTLFSASTPGGSVFAGQIQPTFFAPPSRAAPIGDSGFMRRPQASTSEGETVHDGITCHFCGKANIRGVRYKCLQCAGEYHPGRCYSRKLPPDISSSYRMQ